MGSSTVGILKIPSKSLLERCDEPGSSTALPVLPVLPVRFVFISGILEMENIYYVNIH
jgi:hypothetical protein